MATEFFVYRAALLCRQCGEAERARIGQANPALVPANPLEESSYDSDEFPKGPYLDISGEETEGLVCDICLRKLA